MLVVRDTEPADLPALSELYQEGFGHPLSVAEWEWKYRRLPGEARSMVALLGSELLAHAGAYALPARWQGGEAPAWQLADFVGRPRGLRPPLVVAGRRLLADLPRPHDLPWIFGFPSRRHLELGERVFGYRWLPPIVPWEGALPADAGNSADVESDDRAGAWAEEVWEACGVAGVRRSAAFLDWRYYSRPERYYRVYRLRAGGVDGLAVAAFVGVVAALAELWLPAGPDWTPSLLAVAADLRQAGLERWRAWPQPPRGGDAGTVLLQRLSMQPLAEEVPCGCRGRSGAADDLGDLPRSLYYAMGDHDMV